MKVNSFLVMRVGVMAMLGLSFLATVPPVVRHMAGVVLLDTSPQTALPTPAITKPINVADILAFAPFGRAVQPAVTAEMHSDSTLDLRLKGIFAASSGGSVAMLEVGQETDLFRIGAEVTPSLKVTLISTSHVELMNESETITLRFDETDVTLSAEAQDVGPDTGTQGLLDRLKGDLVVAARYEKPAAPETTSEYIDFWRGRIRKNPQAVLDEIGLKPTEDGYVIAQQHDVGVRLAGLIPGDLVRSVNGQAVGNPDEDRRFYDRIANSGLARLEIERGGRLLTLSFPLR
ncbi:MAG: type II secretion system protein N [Pseudomonadota bacterium]